MASQMGTLQVKQQGRYAMSAHAGTQIITGAGLIITLDKGLTHDLRIQVVRQHMIDRVLRCEFMTRNSRNIGMNSADLC